MKAFDFARVEKKWQKKWEDKGVFDAETNAKKPKFFFTTPYPYISGSLHVGHGRAVVEGDIMCRFKRMRGFNVLFPMAFHISGTPVIGIASGIKAREPHTMKLYEGYVSAYVADKKKAEKIVHSFEDPEAIVKFFIPKMIGEYKGLGLGVDWRRSFTSGDSLHQQLVKWQFQHYHEQGKLVRACYPVLYSPQDQSAMGEDDIKDGDAEPVEKVEFTLVKFPLKDRFLVAATLRPETLFGVTNLWVHPKAQYVEAKVGHERWILTQEAFDKLTYQRSDISFLGIYSDALIGELVRVPLTNRNVRVLPSGFVDPALGTGVVMSVPSDAPYDYVALVELQRNAATLENPGFKVTDVEEIEIIPIISTKKYGDKSAVTVVEKQGIVLHTDPKLEELTQEVYKEGYHSGVLMENCGSFAGMPVREAKEQIKQKLDREGLSSVFYGTSRIAFSRSGGKIIVAVLDDQWFLDFNAAGWKEKARECLQQMKLVPESMRTLFTDTFNWLDKRPCARKRGLGTTLPMDEKWVIESLSDSTMYMTLYAIAHLAKKHKLKQKNMTYEFFEYVFLGKGTSKDVAKKTRVTEKVLKQMRESFQYWMPVDQRHTFQLHLSNHLSFMIFAYAALLPQAYWPRKLTFHGLVVSEGTKMSKSKGNVVTLLEMKKKYGADVFRFYLSSATTLEGTFDWRNAEADTAKDTLLRLHSVIAEALRAGKAGKDVPKLYRSKFNSLVKKATEALDQYKLREYATLVVHDFMRLAKDAKLALNKKELAHFSAMIAKPWITLLTPLCPHIAEELWSAGKGKGFASEAAWPAWDEKAIDVDLEAAEKKTDVLVGDILNIAKLVAEKQGTEVEKVFVYTLPQELSQYNAAVISARVGKPVMICAVNDPQKHDPQQKAGKAKPGKPAIYLE